MISANGGLPAHRYTPQVTPRWPRGSEPASARWRLLRNAPSKGHHSRYITLFFKGTYSVIGFYDLMGMFFGKFNAFCEVILGIFEPFSLVPLA